MWSRRYGRVNGEVLKSPVRFAVLFIWLEICRMRTRGGRMHSSAVVVTFAKRAES